MKILILILLFSSSSLFAQSFKYSDTTFVVGQIKIIEPFDYGTCGYGDRNAEAKDSLYFFLKQHQNLTVEIRIHTDSRGSERYNLLLSQRKSESISNYIIEKGIDSLRIHSVGRGELNPLILLKEIDKMKTQEEKDKAYQTNRRIEIEIVGIKQ